MEGEKRGRTDVDEVGGIVGGGMLEGLCSSRETCSGLCAGSGIRRLVYDLENGAEGDEVRSETTEEEGHEGLEGPEDEIGGFGEEGRRNAHLGSTCGGSGDETDKIHGKLRLCGKPEDEGGRMRYGERKGKKARGIRT